MSPSRPFIASITTSTSSASTDSSTKSRASYAAIVQMLAARPPIHMLSPLSLCAPKCLASASKPPASVKILMHRMRTSGAPGVLFQ